jgi:hypothetical protein
MLVTASQLLTQSRRRRDPLAIFEVASLEQAEAVLAAAVQAENPVILCWSYSEGSTAPLYLRALTELLAQSSVRAGLVCITRGHHTAVQMALVAGAVAVMPSLEGLTEAEAIGLLSWSCDAAATIGAEVILSLVGYEHSWRSLAQQRQYVAPVAAVCTPLTNERGAVVADHVTALVKAFRVPVVASDPAYSVSQRQRLRAMRVSGFLCSTDSDEAYIAGLRTALRDREITRSERVRAYAYQAVQSRAESIITSL